MHDFIAQVQKKLGLNQQQNAIELAITEIMANKNILAIDEFFISDITTAIKIRHILKYLSQKDILVFITSNIEPDWSHMNMDYKDLSLYLALT